MTNGSSTEQVRYTTRGVGRGERGSGEEGREGGSRLQAVNRHFANIMSLAVGISLVYPANAANSFPP